MEHKVWYNEHFCQNKSFPTVYDMPMLSPDPPPSIFFSPDLHWSQGWPKNREKPRNSAFPRKRLRPVRDHYIDKWLDSGLILALVKITQNHTGEHQDVCVHQECHQRENAGNSSDMWHDQLCSCCVGQVEFCAESCLQIWDGFHLVLLEFKRRITTLNNSKFWPYQTRLPNRQSL